MFGGLGYLINGNMAFGIHHGGEVIFRVSEEQGIELMEQPGVRHFEMGGRTSMKNWYMALVDNSETLEELMLTGRDFALSLPHKGK
jgi:TfoX/Sxy family transcriptional regulator of competence genes